MGENLFSRLFVHFTIYIYANNVLISNERRRRVVKNSKSRHSGYSD